MLQRRVVFCGEPGSGKTSLIERIIGNDPPEAWAPTTIAKQYRISSEDLNVWDVGGDPKLRTLAQIYLKEIDVGVVIFDLSSRSSFAAVEEWVNRLHLDSGAKETKIMIVGNKSDLAWAIPEAEIGDLVERLELRRREVSARDGTGVKELVKEISGLCDEAVRSLKPMAKGEPERKQGCCLLG